MNHSSQPVLKQAAAGWDSTSPTSSSANIAADLNLSPKSALAQQSQCICRSPSRVIQYSRNHIIQDYGSKFNFLRSVVRLIPSIRAANSLFPSVACKASSI